MEREKHIYTVLHELVRSRFYNRRWLFWKDPKWISTLPKPSCTMGFGWEKLLYASSPFNSRVRTRLNWLSEQYSGKRIAIKSHPMKTVKAYGPI